MMILPAAKNKKCPEMLYEEALKKVFLKLLRRKSPIVDDTCLQKLLDTLSIFVVSVESAESCGSVQFVKTIKDDPDIGNATQIFGTQVAGRLTLNEEIFVHFENLFQGFYATIFNSAFWQESLSLKTATFHSLKQTIQHPPGFLGMIHQISDISRETFRAIEEESSIFLTKEASDLIAALIVQCSRVQIGLSDCRQSVSEIQHTLLKRCWDCICSAGSVGCLDTRNPFLKPVFLLLCQAETDCKDVFSWLAKQENVLQIIILVILKSESTELWFQAIDVYLDLLHNESLVSDQKNKMADILEKLNKKEQVKKLQTFIVKFLKRHSKEEEIGENLIQLFCQPLFDIEKCISHKSCVEKQPFDPTPKKEPFSSVECEKIISHSIDCWLEILETEIIKKDCIATASRSTSTLLLKIVSILAAKKELQTSRHYLFLNALATSNRFLVKVLQYFCKLSDCGYEQCQLEFDGVVKLLHSSVLFIENFEQTSSVVSHAFQCILCYLPVLLSCMPEGNSTVAPSFDKDDSDCDPNPLMNQSDSCDKMMSCKIPVIIADAVNCCLCHPQWETRDTAVEFLTKVFASCAVSSCLLSWVKKHKLHESVYSSFSDGESYVRATTISAMTVCLQTDALWSDFLTVSQKSLDDILQDFIQVLQTDTEAFPRRAATNFLLETHKSKRLTSSQKSIIYEAVVKVLDSDLDWEVKILAVSVWEDVIKTELLPQTAGPAYALDLLAFSRNRCQACKTCHLVKKIQTLSKIGCTNSLLIAFKDCDNSVCQRVGQVLSKLLFSDKDDEDFTIKQTCAKSEATEKGEDLFNCCTESCCKDLVRDSLKNEGFIFLKRLSEVGFRKDWTESETDCDLYSKNPLSLIEDILADCEEMNEDENKIIDCY